MSKRSYYAIAGLLALSLRAGDNEAETKSLLEYEKQGIDKIARLTAAEHSLILFTIADEIIVYAKNGLVERINRKSGFHNCNRWPHPALSHDGSRVAFVSDSETPHHCRIVIHDIPSGVQRELIETEDDPGEISWSWDDTKIAFWDLRAGLSEVSLSEATKRRLSYKIDPALQFWVWFPMQWLHNDRDLVVEFNSEIPTKNPGEFRQQGNLMLVSPGDARLIDLGSQPAVSPLSDRIAFCTPDGIVTINADGSGRTVLAKAPRSALFFREDMIGRIVWSPDGTRLFFGTVVSENRSDKLYLLDVKSGRTQQFLSHTSIGIRGWH